MINRRYPWSFSHGTSSSGGRWLEVVAAKEFWMESATIEPVTVGLSDLPDALDVATYTAETASLLTTATPKRRGFCDINEVHIFNPLEKKMLKSSR